MRAASHLKDSLGFRAARLTSRPFCVFPQLLLVTPALESVFAIMASGFCVLLCVPAFWNAARSSCKACVVASADVLVELELVVELLSESEEWPCPPW